MATRIDLNQRNIGAILRGDQGGIKTDLTNRARRVAASAGGCEVHTWEGRTRFRATVRTMRAEPAAKRLRLTRALGAGR